MSSKSPQSAKWDRWAILAVLLAAFAYVAFTSRLFNDGDMYWHLGAGRWVSEHAIVPTADPFSFTARGYSWITHEWLSEVMMWAAFALGSWGGIAILFGGAVGLTLLIVGLELNRAVKPIHAAAAMVLLLILLEPSLLARPHVLAWPVAAAWTVLLLRSRDQHRAPPMAAVLIMLVWANLHASFVVGLGMIAFFAAEALIEEPDRKRVLIGWGAFALASFASTLVNPSGLHGLLYAFQVSSMKSLPLIKEWRPSSLTSDPLFFAMTALAALIVTLKRPRIPLLRLLLIAALFYLAVTHARHQALFAIVSLLLVAPSLGRAEDPENRLMLPRAATVALSAGIVLICVIRLSLPLQHNDSPVYPGRAIASVPPSLRSQPVLNAYDFGGALIFNGIAPFIDGRADMYGDDFTANAHAIERGDPDRFDAAVNRWNIRWAILHPSEKLVALLERNPSWRRSYGGKYAVIYVRQ